MKSCYKIIIALFFSYPAIAQEAKRYIGEGEIADIVLEVNDTNATLYASSHVNNEPMQKLKISFQANAEKQEAAPFNESSTPGIYSAVLKGEIDGQILVQSETDTDAIILKAADYSLQPTAKTQAKPVGAFSISSFFLGLAFATFLIFISFFAKIPQRLKRMVGLLCIVFSFTNFSEEIYAHGGHDHGDGEESPESPILGNEIILGKSSQFLIGLRTSEVISEKVSPIMKTFGHIIPKPQNDAIITAPQGGYLKGTQGLVLGKKIKQGDTLGFIQSVAQIRLSSPISGEIAEINAVEGMRVDGGMKILRITNTETLWVDAELFASQIAKFPEANRAYITDTASGSTVEAKIIGAMTPISEETRTAKIYLELINPSSHLKIGTFVEPIFALGKNIEQESLLIPKESVLNRAGEQIAFVMIAPEKFRVREIIVEESSKPGFVLVKKGLKEGERVVTEGNYQLLMKVK